VDGTGIKVKGLEERTRWNKKSKHDLDAGDRQAGAKADGGPRRRIRWRRCATHGGKGIGSPPQPHEHRHGLRQGDERAERVPLAGSSFTETETDPGPFLHPLGMCRSATGWGTRPEGPDLTYPDQTRTISRAPGAWGHRDDPRRGGRRRTRTCGGDGKRSDINLDGLREAVQAGEGPPDERVRRAGVPTARWADGVGGAASKAEGAVKPPSRSLMAALLPEVLLRQGRARWRRGERLKPGSRAGVMKVHGKSIVDCSRPKHRRTRSSLIKELQLLHKRGEDRHRVIKEIRSRLGSW